MKWTLPCLGLLAISAQVQAFYPLMPDNPRVCQARMNKDMLELRYFRGSAPLVMDATATAKNEKGEPYQYTIKLMRQSFVEQQLAVEAAHVEAYQDGKKIDGKDLAGLLAKETPVLACSVKPTLDLTRITKKGTLLLIVPVSLDMYGSYGGPPVTIPLPGPEPKPIPPKGT